MEGMSAIPIMNAKMDTGLDIAPANERGKLSIEDAALPLESNQLIGLMDSLFISVIEWLKGQMLDQNFACVYVVNVDNVESRIFRSYLSGLFGIMMLARQLIGSAGVYYDEDFCPDSHELDLEPRDNAPVVDLIKYFKENLIEILKEPREKFGDLFGALDSTIIDNESIETHIPAIIDRFQFLIVTIEIFERLLNNDDVDGLQKAIQLALCQLELISKTVCLGTNMDHSFDVMIHRKFFPQTPMAVKKLPTNEGIEIWKEMLQQLSQIALIKSKMRPDFLFGISFLIYFSISPSPISEYLKDSISSFVHVPYFESINENILEITSVALSQCSKKWELLQMDLERADVQLYELDQKRPDANSSIQHMGLLQSPALLQPAQYLATLHPIYEQDIKLFLEEVITVFVTCQLSWIDLEKAYPNDPNIFHTLIIQCLDLGSNKLSKDGPINGMISDATKLRPRTSNARPAATFKTIPAAWQDSANDSKIFLSSLASILF
ncbi:hypothetical protein HDV02_006126 [Globomyces sp. JEL0801]|nr:hypothetical protein HDV02_006126 [Globomyces sp. JEL0801]